MPSPLLAILDKCNSHPSPLRDPKGYSEALANYTFFQYNNVTLGYLLPPVVAALRSYPEWEQDWHITDQTVEFASADNFEERSEVIKSTLEKWRASERFRVLKGVVFLHLRSVADGMMYRLAQ